MWKNKPPDSENFRKIFEDIFEYATVNNFKFWHYLGDTKKEGIISPEDRKWLQEVMVPKANEYGIKKLVLLSEETDPFKRYYLNMLLRWTNRNMSLKMKIFNSEEKAYEWFRESFKK